MRVLFLHAEIMGYTNATLRALVALGASVEVVHWDHRKLTPYVAPDEPGIRLHARSKLGPSELSALVDSVRPDLAVVCGWMDTGYLPVARRLCASGVPVVVGFDDQWHGTLRQWGASLIGHAGFLRLYFSHAWVSGAPQYEYARRLGFPKRSIVHDLYAADADTFGRVSDAMRGEHDRFRHTFLFVGRLEDVKGLDVLIEAWRLLQGARMDWCLRIIGNGSLRPVLDREDGVEILDFLQPHQLADAMAEAGVLVLPSHDEPWGVVVHEAALAGLPVLCSDVVGAASALVIPGWNGSIFRAGRPHDLARAMTGIIGMSDAALRMWSDRSRGLGRRISPEHSAASLLSVLSR